MRQKLLAKSEVDQTRKSMGRMEKMVGGSAGVPTGELAGFEEGMSAVLTGNGGSAAAQDAANLGRLSANAGKGSEKAEEGMSSMQRALESSNAAATKTSDEVLNVKGRLMNVLSGK